MQWVRVPAITNADCDSDYSDATITDSMICAGYRGEGGKDACQGDSGGPFVCQDENNKAIIAGRHTSSIVITNVTLSQQCLDSGKIVIGDTNTKPKVH